MIRFNRAICGSVVGLLCSLPAIAKCPVSDGATVVIKAAVGDLVVDTSSREAAVDVSIDNNALQFQENCGKTVIEYSANAPDQMRGVITWRISTPKTVNLDLVTLGGNITVGDLDANALLRTAGGSITAGNIRGKAALTTQGGSIRSGNIGSDAELRSQGGTVEVGDIGGVAEIDAKAGAIRTGNIAGAINAQGGRTISIGKAGEVKATTNAGDITIADASRINAKSGGGSIFSKRVRGPFEGHTERGDIRLDSAASWVEASTGSGNIVVRMVPDNLEGDLHMNLQAGVGDVTVYLPARLRGSVDATIQRPTFQGPGIFSEFPPVPSQPPIQGLAPNRFYTSTHSQSLLNGGGGNKIVLHTGLGKISIRKN